MSRKEGIQALLKRHSNWIGVAWITGCAFAAWAAPAVLS